MTTATITNPTDIKVYLAADTLAEKVSDVVNALYTTYPDAECIEAYACSDTMHVIIYDADTEQRENSLDNGGGLAGEIHEQCENILTA